MKTPLLTAAVTTAALTAAANAAVLVGYSSTNGAAVAPSDVAPNLTGLNLTRGPGLNQNTGGTFNSNGFTSGMTVGSAVTAGDYTSFGFSVNPGSQVDLTTIDFGYDRSGTGPAQVTLRSSVDGFNSDLFTDTSVDANGEAVTGIDLSGLTDLMGTIEFRLYGFNASSMLGSFDYEDRVAGNTRGIVVNGEVEMVPAMNADPEFTMDTFDFGDVVVGEAFSGAVTASDDDSDPLTFTAGADLPDFLTFNSDGTFSGTPDTEGPFSFDVTVFDGTATDSATVQFNVIPEPLSAGAAGLIGLVALRRRRA